MKKLEGLSADRLRETLADALEDDPRQGAHRSSPTNSARSSNRSSTTRPRRSGTTPKRGGQRTCATTSTRSSTLSTPSPTLAEPSSFKYNYLY